MITSYLLSMFWKEMPAFFFFFGIFMPVTVFLLLLIAYCWIKLLEVLQSILQKILLFYATEEATKMETKDRVAKVQVIFFCAFIMHIFVNEELAMEQDPRKALLNYHSQWQKARRSGQKENKRKN